MNNEAQQLYDLLNFIKVPSSKKATKSAPLDIIMSHFHLPDGDLGLIYKVLAGVITWPNSIEEKLSAIPHLTPSAVSNRMGWKSSVQGALNHFHPNGNLNNMMQVASDSNMALLKISADEITEYYPILAIDVNEINKKLGALFDEISLSEIDMDIKNFLLVKIDELRESLMYYTSQGIKPLRNTLESIVGAIELMDPSTRKRIEKEPLWKKVYSVTKETIEIVIITGWIMGYQTLPEMIQHGDKYLELEAKAVISQIEDKETLEQFAERMQVDISLVEGTEPDGNVSKQDIAKAKIERTAELD